MSIIIGLLLWIAVMGAIIWATYRYGVIVIFIVGVIATALQFW